ncbi:hypothetical protein ENBRE01_1261 [Enteropsectra breve]|nr:hypothetical protein ENBRE01_1261 [Enteropsectra breve]
MLAQFAERNLKTTVKFLHKLGLEEEVVISHNAQIQYAIDFQNRNQHKMAYRVLSCDESTMVPDRIYFCSCCSTVLNFIRNYSLFHCISYDSKRGLDRYKKKQELTKELQIKTNGIVHRHAKSRNNLFYDYIEALANKNIALLKEVIALSPLFWDAYLSLVEMTDNFIEVDGDLSGYFYMHLKVQRDFDHRTSKHDYFLPLEPKKFKFPFKIEIKDLNLVGAFLYASGYLKEAEIVFSWVLSEIFGINSPECLSSSLSLAEKERHAAKLVEAENNLKLIFEDGNIRGSADANNIEFIEIAAYILEKNNTEALKFLNEIIQNEYPDTFEAAAIAGCYSQATNEYHDAIQHYRQALRTKRDARLFCKLGHLYRVREDEDNMAYCYDKATERFPNNANVLCHYAMDVLNTENEGMAKELINKALLLNSSAGAWLAAGKIHLQNNLFSNAKICFSEARRQGCTEALLLLTELEEKEKPMGEVEELYKEYLNTGAEVYRKNVAQKLFDGSVSRGETHEILEYFNAICEE